MLTELISTEPATGAILWRGMTGDVDDEVAEARAAWAGWAAKPFTVRVETMRRFANTVRSRIEPFADLIARETGKPLWEARGEVESVVAKVDISISAYAERTAQHNVQGAMGARTAIRHKPHGVLAVLGPYNFPAHLPNGHIVPALLAGNAVVFKPSEKTPATGEFLVDCYHAAGVPAGIVRLLTGGPAEGAALAAHPGIDGLLFTGSARAGMSLHRAFAEMPHKILALELGGNNPLVVWDTPDIHTAAIVAVQSAYMSAGQRCTAARRLIVCDKNHEPLIAAICKLIERLIVDEPHAKPAPFMGPVIDNDAADRVEEAFLDLLMKGGRPINHLVRKSADLPFLSPALIDVTDVAERPDVEIFGPVLQIVRVADFDAAIVEANATRYGLAASLVGGTPEHYNRFWGNVRAGVVNWNRPTNGAPSNAPFGGVGMSGNHRPSAYYAADYCAYPVVSSETDQARAAIGIGLRDGRVKTGQAPAIASYGRPGAGRGPCLYPRRMAPPVERDMDPGLRRDDGSRSGMTVEDGMDDGAPSRSLASRESSSSRASSKHPLRSAAFDAISAAMASILDPDARGRVILVGAGPGDPGLLTVRAVEALRVADVVVHDGLIDDRVLDHAPNAQRISVAKKRARHTLPQDAINALIIAHVRAGSIVVRLKGGDPFVFGRGGEEVEAVRAAGLPVEVIPGVSAALGCAADAMLPLTHRDWSSAVSFVAGQCKGLAEQSWAGLAGQGRTLVIYMGISCARLIADKLMMDGVAPDMPVAVLERGTLPGARAMRTLLADLGDMVEREGVVSPGIIVVGEVVRLSDAANKLAALARRAESIA